MSGREKRMRLTVGQYQDMVSDIARGRAQYAELECQLGDLRVETNRRLRRQERRLTERIEEVGREFDRRTTAVERGLSQLRQEREHNRRRAERMIELARAEYRLIETTLRHAQFAPGELDTPKQRLDQALEDLPNHSFETAITTARDTLTTLLQLHERIESDAAQWDTLRDAARSALARLDDTAERTMLVPGVDLDGEELPELVNVDHWTNGGLSAVRTEIATLVAQVNDDANPMSTVALKSLLDTEVTELGDQITGHGSEACVSAMASQMRLAIAGKVIEGLRAQGILASEPGGFEEDDFRQAMMVRLVDAAQQEVIVRVSADPDDRRQCRVTIEYTNPDERSTESFWARSRALSAYLNGIGLPFSPPERPDEQAERQPVRQRPVASQQQRPV